MKKLTFMLIFLLSTLFFSSISEAVDFDLTLFGAGAVERQSLVMQLSMLNVCSARGYCEIGGYGYEATHEEDIINFKGEGLNVGDYYYLWLSGKGIVTSQKNGIFFSTYDIQIKIYLPSIVTWNMNTYYALVQVHNGSLETPLNGTVMVILK